MTSPLELTQQTAEHLQQRISALANQLKQTADSLHQGEPADLQHLAGEITEVQTQIESLSQQVHCYQPMLEGTKHRLAEFHCHQRPPFGNLMTF